jgi:hypothetical protein
MINNTMRNHNDSIQHLETFMKRFSSAGAALVLITLARLAGPTEAIAVEIAVRCKNDISPNRIRAMVVLPGEAVTFDVVDPDREAAYVAQHSAGQIEPLGSNRWMWTPPPTPGHYPIRVVAPDGNDAVTLQAFVAVPYNQLRGENLNGFRVGKYPEKPLRGLAIYNPPIGFIEVTRENENELVSPHFRLGQFVCKQQADSSKYIVLNERLPLALEYALKCVNEAGIKANTFHIMSGYRTPAYNHELGNVSYSLHLWGAAADIFIDEDGDGMMDDLNGDGRIDIGDAEVLYRLIDEAAFRPESQGLIGGLGKYPATSAHGPFVHVDVRESKARW